MSKSTTKGTIRITDEKKVVVLLSGGIDSQAVAYGYHVRGWEVHALHIKYGNRVPEETEAARLIAEKIGAPFTIIDIPDLNIAFKKDANTPKVAAFRNNIMLTIAASYGVTRGIYNVALGAHADDYLLETATFFPDCAPDAMKSTEYMLNMSSGNVPNIKICTPYIEKTKAQLIAHGIEAGMDPEDSISCYMFVDGKPCGECESCKLREEAINEANNLSRY